MKWPRWTISLAVLATLPGFGWAGAGPDHLACYKIRDSAMHAVYTAGIGGLTAQPGCMIRVPATMLCAPAMAAGMMPVPPSEGGIGKPNSFTCYKVRCPLALVAPVVVQDEFGPHVLQATTTSLLCAPNAGPTDGGFPASGQTTCWGSNGIMIACAGTGQDGEMRPGAPLAYVDNGDGTITDVNTGLMWEKESNGDGSIHDMNNSYTWDQAFSSHVATLNGTVFAGHTDWRVPNYKELISILDLQHVNPAVSPAFNTNCTPACTVLSCSCTQGNFYWSSSTNHSFPQDAWLVYFFDGYVDGNFKVISNNVRAVRGGS